MTLVSKRLLFQKTELLWSSCFKRLRSCVCYVCVCLCVCRSDVSYLEEDDRIEDGWSATESMLSTSIASSLSTGAFNSMQTALERQGAGYLGGKLSRDIASTAALYRSEIQNPLQASAVAKAGALLRRTMQVLATLQSLRKCCSLSEPLAACYLKLLQL